jgi:hypothetical protein
LVKRKGRLLKDKFKVSI